jgi:hypothetical protein
MHWAALNATRALTAPAAAPALAHAAFQQAAALQALTKGRVSLDLALFALTEQPALAAMPPPLLARRIQALSGALNIKQADAAHLLAANPRLARLQPYECAAAPAAAAPPPPCRASRAGRCRRPALPRPRLPLADPPQPAPPPRGAG